MNRRISLFLLAVSCILAASTATFASIPEPSVLLYGTLSIGGEPVGAGDDVRLYAMVPEAPDEVGSYLMGSNVNAGNLYALQVRLESLADGTQQSNNRALVGQTVQVFAEGDDVPGGPVLLTNFKICERGQVVNIDLPGTVPGNLGDFDGDCDVDFDDLNPFVDVLLGNNMTPSAQVTADMNASGAANGADIELFVQALLNNG